MENTFRNHIISQINNISLQQVHKSANHMRELYHKNNISLEKEHKSANYIHITFDQKFNLFLKLLLLPSMGYSSTESLKFIYCKKAIKI